MSEQPSKSWLNLTENPLHTWHKVFIVVFIIAIAILVGITNNLSRIAEWQFLALLAVILVCLVFDWFRARMMAVLKHRGGRLAFLATIIVSAGFWLHYSPWTGFRGQFIPPFTEPARDLWDWLQLLGVLAVPIVVAVIGYQIQQREAQRQVEVFREQRLSDFLDHINNARLEGYNNPDSELIRFVQAWTDMALQGMDQARLRTIIDLLRDVRLIVFTEEGQNPRIMLKSLNLKGMDFKEMRFDEVFLVDSVFVGTNLKGSSFLNANLGGADLTDADMSGSNLTGANLRGATFTFEQIASAASLVGAKLRGKNDAEIWAYRNMKRWNLREVIFDRCEMSAVDLRGATLDEARFVSCKMDRAKLSNASLWKALLRDANLTEAVLNDAKGHGANLSGAILHGAELTGADLTGANLTGADMAGADLTNAIFDHAKLQDAILVNALLVNCSFKSTQLDQDGNLIRTNLRGAILSGATLTGANLTGADLTGATLDADMEAQLKDTIRDSTTIMPDGQPYKPYRDVVFVEDEEAEPEPS